MENQEYGATEEIFNHVNGKLTDAGGNPLGGAIVVLYHQRIRKKIPLAEGRSLETGEYRLRYKAPFHENSKLLIVVEARSEHSELVLRSAVTPAKTRQEINLYAHDTRTPEYDKLLRLTLPLLDNLPLADVEETPDHQDITFLSKETGKPNEQIMRLAFAARMHEAFDLPASIFYAFLPLKVPSSLPDSLLEASAEFTLIDSLVRRVGSLIFAVSSEAQVSTLQNAIDKNLIGHHLRGEIPAIVRQLQHLKRTDLLNSPYIAGKTTLAQLLTLSNVPSEMQHTFAGLLGQNTQPMNEFWNSLKKGENGFSEQEVTTIERTLSVGVLMKNFVPLMKLVLPKFTAGDFKQVSDLAKLNITDWEDMVSKSGTPALIDTAGDLTVTAVFARTVYARITRAYPTIALVSRGFNGKIFPEDQQKPLRQFFINNPGLNLLRHNVAAYIGQQKNAFEGITKQNQSTVLANTRRLQRMLYVTRDADAAQSLLEMNIHSASQIAGMGRQQFFLAATNVGIGKQAANKIFDSSSQRYASLISLYAKMNRDARGHFPKAIGNYDFLDGPIAKAVAADESLATLFGSQDYCEVDDCTSILSPAAYLCDMLHWLSKRLTSGMPALTVLDLRRPDISNLLLNCPNTDTAMPYIDLVNEILADAISLPSDPNSTINPPWKQTSSGKTPDDLRAAPEYFNKEAFSTLFNASYPHTLPYSEGLDELRSYVQQSGIALWQIRKALLPLHSPVTAQLRSVAAERFSITGRAADIVSTPDFLTSVVAWSTPAPASDLAQIPDFLQAASLTYNQLLELLQCSWVQGGLGITIQGIDDTCNTAVQSLTPSPLDAGFLDRAHRFLRLWRVTSYPMWQLDLLLRSASVANGVLDPTGLIALGNFRSLQDTTKLDTDAQLAWFQDMDNAVHLNPDQTNTTPLFRQIFLNPAVVSLHPDPDLAALAAGTALADNNLNHHLDGIQAAIGISGQDASSLITLFGFDAAGTLTISNLSQLYRITQLATTLKLGISDLLSLAPLINRTAASASSAINEIFADAVAASDFISKASEIKQSGLLISDFVYLLTPPAATIPQWMQPGAISETAIGNLLASVRLAIVSADPADINGSVIAAVAGQLSLASDVTAFLMETLTLSGTTKTLLAILTDSGITSPAGGPYPDTTRVNYPDVYGAIQLLNKLRIIVNKLHLVVSDVSWLITNTSVYDGLDFGQLPILPAQAVLGTADLLNTVLLIKLSRLFNAAPPSSTPPDIYGVITGIHSGALASESSIQASVATITGWNLADVVGFCSALGVQFPDDYLLPATYDAIRNLFSMIASTAGKASASQLISWGVDPADEEAAETMAASALKVLKARYKNPDWLAAAPAIVNPLREHRAAALQNYLIGNGDHAGNKFPDVDRLFDFFLIDTQMSSCQVTTRVIQAYIATQIFVERCRMNLEAPAVLVDPTDEIWDEWSWMKRYRIWEAAREVFLFPENWLIESQRLSRTEIYKKLEQDVHQNEQTSGNLETASLNYLDGLEKVAHLRVTGSYKDPDNGSIYVVGRVHADPPVYYYRILENGVWSGWIHVPLDIKSHQVVPAVYAGKLSLFWLEVRAQNEPRQTIPAPQTSSTPPSQEPSKYVTLSLSFSTFRNGSWATAQSANGKLFDVPLLTSMEIHNNVSIESLYTLKIHPAAANGSYGATLYIDIFRLGAYDAVAYFNAVMAENADLEAMTADEGAAEVFGNLGLAAVASLLETQAINELTAAVAAGNLATQALLSSTATQVGRGIFDGRLEELEQRNLNVLVNGQVQQLLAHAQSSYGPDAFTLLPLPDIEADPNITGEPGLVPKAGLLMSDLPMPDATGPQSQALTFTAFLGSGDLLSNAPLPFRVVGDSADIAFDPTSYFFFQDNRRCYFVESLKSYWTGSFWSPTPPSDPSNIPFEVSYSFHRFYHPYTKLLWHELAASGFKGIYNPKLQQTPDQIDPSHADIFSFSTTYQPNVSTVTWGEDNEILDFTPGAAYSVYNWEIFFHNPLYVAGLLSQNQQFEDAMKWFHYIFDPTRSGSDPVPQRFWITKPLNQLTDPVIQAEQINNLLVLVNKNDPDADNQVLAWREDPFNPYLIADLRPVAYMKNVVMQYLDNLIAWADNLFATNSREALSEATLLYVIAAEILGPRPAAVKPPQHADKSYKDLSPLLDNFSNALVDIENVLGPGGGSGGGSGGTGISGLHTFYFKIPPNDKLLGYWDTVADRLFKLRHCQNLQGGALDLALFDAPIDPGLLIKARAAGVDIGSVLSDISAPLPNYRYTAMYAQALDFVNAVRAYGQSLIGALEKSDADQFALLQQTVAISIQQDMDQIFQWQIDKSQSDIDALNEALAIAQAKLDFNNNQDFANGPEVIGMLAKATASIIKTIAAAAHTTSTITYLLPAGTAGIEGMGGTPVGAFTEGGKNAGDSSKAAGFGATNAADVIDAIGTAATTFGSWQRRQEGFQEAAREANLQLKQTTAQIASAQILLRIAQQNQANHQKQEDYIQKQIDFLTNKFTNQDLYDWQVGQLADTYFQSYKLAYRLCKQVERCYQYELGITDSRFIQFGYWDSLHKGLLAGETLNNDLRRMQASYLELNTRKFELSRFISLSAIDPAQFQQLLLTGSCSFDLPESLFDNDYPGHYNRHILRMSVTVVYPSPGKFDNVKATLTLVANKVRIATTAASSAEYGETGTGDARFAYNYGAVSQKIALGNGQDDPGLFFTALNNNMGDPRYVPFEGAGAISSWNLKMPESTNEIDLSSVSDVVFHLYYTAIDGGDTFTNTVEKYNEDNQPASGLKLFSARNDFAAPVPTIANPYPLSPWDTLVTKPAATDPDQALVLTISPLKFPSWARGKTITITGLSLITVGWTSADLTIQPLAPLAQTPATITPAAVSGTTNPYIASAALSVPANLLPGKWSFSIKTAAATDFRSLTKNDIGDILLLLTYEIS